LDSVNRRIRMLWQANDHDRLLREKQFHEGQAFNRSNCPSFAENLAKTNDWYLGHVSWIAHAVDLLRPLTGKVILDWGCGHGMASSMFASLNANVFAIDLSGGYCRETRLRALNRSVDVSVVQSDGLRLPFPNEVFDAVWGHAMIHHLSIRQALVEVRRVLKPDGVFVFCDPFQGGELIRVLRSVSGFLKGHRTVDEHPICWSDLRFFPEIFPHSVATFWDIPLWFQGRLQGSWPKRRSTIQSFARYVVVTNAGLEKISN